MKTNERNFFVIISCFLLLSLFTDCADKGCTNKLALNYDITANKDDGSCVICKLTQSKLDSTNVGIIDNNSSSQFFGQTVALLNIIHSSDSYNNSLCGPSDSCSFYYSVTNLVNKQINASFILEGDGNVSFEIGINNVIVNPSQTSLPTLISANSNSGNLCAPIGNSTFDVFNENITYQ
jgi:hypothetical protein